MTTPLRPQSPIFASDSSEPLETILSRAASRAPLQSTTQFQIDSLVSGFLSQATDWKSLAAMTAGGLAYRLGKISVLGIGAIRESPLLGRSLAIAFGLASEVSAFEFTNRSLNTFWATGQSPLQDPSRLWSWSDPGGWKEGLLSSLITFGILKGFGKLSEAQNIILQHGFQDAGMVLGHQLVYRAGIGPKPEGSLAEQLVHAEATNLQLATGMGLLHALAPRLNSLERGLELQIRTRIVFSPPSHWTRLLSPPSSKLAFEIPPTSPKGRIDSSLGKQDPLISFPPKNRPLEMSGLGLELSQRMEHRLELKHELSIKSVHEEWERVYDEAEKRTYRKYGLDFEYAVVRRQDFPYLLKIGSAGLSYGRMRFVMEDFFVDPKIDLETRRMLIELIAVHEYGESVFHNHHQASLLEFEIAKRENFLEKYLSFLEEKYFLKFRDVALHRMESEFNDALEESGVQIAGLEGPQNAFLPLESEDSSSESAKALRDSFRWQEDLRERYAHALDESEELAREKVQDWASYIVVNEQIRGYLSRASQEGLEAGQKTLSDGKSISQAFTRIKEAFYRSLYPLYLEVREELLAKKFFEKELLETALKKSLGEMLEKLQIKMEGHLRDPEEKKKGLEVLRRLPLFSRSLDEHLKISEQEYQWLEHFRLEDFPQEDEDFQKENLPVLEGARKAFWDFIDVALAEGAAESEKAAFKRWKNLLPLFSRLREYLSLSLEGSRISDPQEYEWHLRTGIHLGLFRLAREEKNRFAKIPDTTLQLFTDFLLLEFSAGRELKVPIKIDVGELRKTHGKNLKNLFPAEAFEEHWRKEQYLLEAYDEANPKAQDQIVEELNSRWAYRSQDDLRGIIESRKISFPLRTRLLLKNLERTPFFEEGDLSSVLPILIRQYELSRDQVAALFKMIFLKKLARIERWEEVSFAFRFNNVEWPDPEKTLKTRLFYGTPQKLPVLWDYLQEPYLRDWFKAASENGIGKVQEEIEQTFRARGIDGQRLLNDLHFFNKIFRARQDLPFQEAWQKEGFWKKLQTQEPKEIEKIVWDILRIESAKDLLAWISVEGDLSKTSSKKKLASPLKNADVSRKNIAQAWFESHHPGRKAKVSWPSTSVDPDFFLKLDPSTSSIRDVIANYRLLMILSNPYLFKNRETALNFTRSTFEVFLKSGDPRLERAAVFIMAKALHLPAIEIMIGMAESDEEARREFLSLRWDDRKDDPAIIPYISKIAQWYPWSFIPSLIEFANKGHLGALNSLLLHPDIKDQNSTLLKDELHRINLDKFRKNKEAFPALNTLSELGVPVPRTTPLPEPSRTFLYVAAKLTLKNQDKVRAAEEELRSMISPMDQRSRVELAQQLVKVASDIYEKDRVAGLRLLQILIPFLDPKECSPLAEALLPHYEMRTKDYHQDNTATYNAMRAVFSTLLKHLEPSEEALIKKLKNTY